MRAARDCFRGDVSKWSLDPGGDEGWLPATGSTGHRFTIPRRAERAHPLITRQPLAVRYLPISHSGLG
jgi:hypothetical protein